MINNFDLMTFYDAIMDKTITNAELMTEIQDLAQNIKRVNKEYLLEKDKSRDPVYRNKWDTADVLWNTIFDFLFQAKKATYNEMSCNAEIMRTICDYNKEYPRRKTNLQGFLTRYVNRGDITYLNDAINGRRIYMLTERGNRLLQEEKEYYEKYHK